MPLSSKLRADYIELINQQLDNIQIDSIEGFALAQQALQNIIQPVEGYSSPEKYREKMFLIKDYLQSPEDYVEHERNYSEYQQIIRERIAAKANELQSLNTTQKQAYIQHQQAQRSQTAANQQIMAQRHPPQPGSDAHVQTETENDMTWAFTATGSLDAIRRLYAISIAGRNAQESQAEQTQRLIDMQAIRHLDTVRQEDLELQTGQRNLIENGQAFGLNESQLEAVRMYVIDKLSVVRAMFNRIFSMLDFKDLTTEQISNVGTIALANPNCITALSDGRTTITQLADMDVDSLRQAVESDDYPSIGLRS